MAEWSEAQVSEWISLIDLPDGCAETVQALFSESQGKDLLSFTPKALQVSLRFGGIAEPGRVAATILRQRDSAASQSTATRAGAGVSEAPECPLCMEPFLEDDSGKHVPRILQCGHSACQDCYARMLRPIVAENNNVKRLTCPNCREVADVAWGRAENLPQVFGMLR